MPRRTAPNFNINGNQDVHKYEISLKAKVGGEIEEYQGSCEMSVGPLWSSLVAGLPSSETQGKVDAVDAFDREFSGMDEGGDSTPVNIGTGTAFSVSSKGHLLTCAHVVDGADKITVTVNGKKQPAKLLLLDTENDLALLKLEKGRVKALTIADSDKVDIGEGVTAFGFPLAKSLGGKVKVSRGALSGIMINSEGKRLQIDASVNPGNSGGPVVNDRGEVIGVASSKLSGEGISGIGFAIPINSVIKHLEDLDIDFRKAKAAGARDRSGPQLVKLIGGGVLLVEASQTGKLSEGDVEVQFRGAVSRVGAASYPHSRQQPKNESNMFVVDPFGQIQSNTGEVDLPFARHTFPELLVVQLSNRERDTWHHQQDTVILRPAEGKASARTAFARRATGSRATTTLETVRVRERTDYKVVSEKNGLIELE